MSQKNKIFIWKEPDDWYSVINGLLHDFIPHHIKSAIEANPEGYFYSTIEWQNGVPVRRDDGQEVKDLITLWDRFENTYSYIRMFHACRPDNIGAYLEKGFVPPDEKTITQKAMELFLSPKFPQVKSEQIDETMKDLRRERRENKLYFCLDDADLILHAGHYLKYGSEYLLAIAKELSRKTGDSLE